MSKNTNIYAALRSLGVGSFTIIDDADVVEADCGNNFFVSADVIGQSRAEVVTRNLVELNSDVKGNFIIKKVNQSLELDVFRDFDIIISPILSLDLSSKLSELCWELNIPLVFIQSCGFYGYLRLQVAEHTIHETHPESIMDLRLDQPWGALTKLADSINLESLDSHDHSHIPYVLILLIFANSWKAAHGGKLPSSMDEKAAFKNELQAAKIYSDEENFDEAVSAAWRLYRKTEISPAVKAVLNDSSSLNLTSQSSSFWIMARSLADFVADPRAGNGFLPVSGSLPDMKADSSSYIYLQNAYKRKATEDADNIYHRVLQYVEKLNSPRQISREMVDSFCKHSAYLQVVRSRKVATELEREHFENVDTSSEGVYHIYVALRALMMANTRPRLDEVQAEISILRNNGERFCAGDSDLNDRVGLALEELRRCNIAELHNIASLMGGMGAQEIIKIITKQYVPINNTCIFDGILSKSQVFNL